MTSPSRDAAKAALPALLIGTGVFAVYAAGACPTIYVGDSGELVAAVDVLGIPHPSGYPLYVLLGKLWTVVLPFGSIAWRMSLFSAVAAAAACGLLYTLARVGGLTPAAGVAASLTLAFSPSFWSQANIQRVYSLGAFFVVLTTIAVFGWWQGRQTRVLGLAFFLCGLGAANHTFMGVYAVLLGAYAFAGEPRVRRPRALAAMTAALAVGLLPYLYLPLRSAQNPLLDWGNPETLGGFIDVVLRRDFWDRAWVQSTADGVAVALDYLRSFVDELTWPGAALFAGGVWAAWTRGWPVTLLSLIMLANVGTLALHGSRADIFIWHRYYIPSYVIAALFVGAGLDAIMRAAPARVRWLALVLPLFLLVSGWPRYDRSRFEVADAYARVILESLPPGAHLVASDDNILFSLIYLTMVEKLRPDVHLIQQGIGAAELPPLRFDGEDERLFFTHHPNWSLSGLEIVPLGLVFEARRPGGVVVAPSIPRDTLPGEDDAAVPKDYLTRNMIGDFHYMLGFTLLEHDRPRAMRELERAAASAPDNAVLVYNLGLLYRGLGMLDEALAAFRRAHEIEPRALATRTRPRAADRIIEVEVERRRRSSER